MGSSLTVGSGNKSMCECGGEEGCEIWGWNPGFFEVNGSFGIGWSLNFTHGLQPQTISFRLWPGKSYRPCKLKMLVKVFFPHNCMASGNWVPWVPSCWHLHYLFFPTATWQSDGTFLVSKCLLQVISIIILHHWWHIQFYLPYRRFLKLCLHYTLLVAWCRMCIAICLHKKQAVSIMCCVATCSNERLWQGDVVGKGSSSGVRLGEALFGQIKSLIGCIPSGFRHIFSHLSSPSLSTLPFILVLWGHAVYISSTMV